MLKTKLAYLKGISEALKTYDSEHAVIDFELVQKIYNYANNIDNLTEEQLNELEDFINENTVSIKHLANLYLDKKGEADLNNRLNRMLPIQITKPQCRIKFVKGRRILYTDLERQTTGGEADAPSFLRFGREGEQK